jgi:predicted enzyme related to lactoylglutathione lyase
LLAVTLLAGCAGLDPARIPPIDASNTQPSPGKVVWHDLLTTDPEAARRFYTGLFGWTFRDLDLGGGQTYVLIEHEGRGIGGLVDAREMARGTGGLNVSRWVPVLSVPDMDVAMAAVLAAGGTVFQAPIDIPQRGSMAVIGDPEGAVVTLLEPRAGDPADRPAGPGDWLWNEIWTSDPDATLAFYRSLVPAFTVGRADDAAEGYPYLSAGGVPRVGVLPKPVAEIADTWVSYIKVMDPAATAAAAERLGGRVLLPARPNPRGGEVAILNDPSGAGFLVQRWQADTGGTNARP